MIAQRAEAMCSSPYTILYGAYAVKLTVAVRCMLVEDKGGGAGCKGPEIVLSWPQHGATLCHNSHTGVP